MYYNFSSIIKFFSTTDMEGLSFFIGVTGNIISVLMFLSPISTFWRIIREGSTNEFGSLPYICTFLNSSLWTYYGIIKSGELLVATVNGFGVIVETIYITIFLIYTPKEMKAKTAILVGILDVGFLAMAIGVTQLALKGDSRIDVVGFMGAGLNIIMYGSPLAAMKTVVTTKSVEFMPFFLTFFFFLNGGIWAFYALLVHDYILAVPNGIGFLLGSAQLVLYAIHRNAKPTKKTLNDSVEEGWQREHLIPSSPQSIAQEDREIE